jgi:hypothetical protein
MIAASAAAELGTEVRALNLIVPLNLTPGFVTQGAGNIDFQSHSCHRLFHHWDTENDQEIKLRKYDKA